MAGNPLQSLTDVFGMFPLPHRPCHELPELFRSRDPTNLSPTLILESKLFVLRDVNRHAVLYL